MEALLYQTIGQQQVHLNQLERDNAALLQLLAAIKAGKVDPRRLVIEGDVVKILPPIPAEDGPVIDADLNGRLAVVSEEN